MAMNGTDVLLLVNTGTTEAPVYTVVGSQRNLSRERTNAEIDVSSKDQREMRVLPGRYGSTMSLDALYVPDHASYLLLSDACDDGEMILVRISEEGVETKEATAMITSMSEEFPDQEAATITVELRIDGAWTPVGS